MRAGYSLMTLRALRPLSDWVTSNLNAVAFVQRFEAFATDHGEVNEYILSPLVLGNKTEALLLSNHLMNPLSHVRMFLRLH